MRISGQTGTGGPPDARPVPVPTQPITRPSAGVQDRTQATQTARAQRPLRVIPAERPDRWHNPTPTKEAP